MTSTDPIADMLAIIKNGINRKKEFVILNSSKLRKEILRILDEENYIAKYSILEKSDTKNRKFEMIKIFLKYAEGDKSVIQNVQKISRPGKRVYVSSKEIPVVLNHIGIAILSTNKGLMTDRNARKEKIGGEYICKIW